jgi:hypothetical protein
MQGESSITICVLLLEEELSSRLPARHKCAHEAGQSYLVILKRCAIRQHERMSRCAVFRLSQAQRSALTFCDHAHDLRRSVFPAFHMSLAAPRAHNNSCSPRFYPRANVRVVRFADRIITMKCYIVRVTATQSEKIDYHDSSKTPLFCEAYALTDCVIVRLAIGGRWIEHNEQNMLAYRP